MKKVIIPRKDHEVYFLPEPEEIKNKKRLQQYVNEQMEKLHPAFSSRMLTDIERIFLNGKAWLMITIMDEELLAEYRLLYNRSYFFTNTSIRIGKKGFTGNGVHTIDDEKIGFDIERNEPVSIPLDTDNGKLKQENGKISMRYSVFRKKTPPWCVPAISAALFIAFLLLIIIFIPSQVKKVETAETVLSQHFSVSEEPESGIPLKTVPPSIQILASVAVDVVNAGGKILNWHYSAVSDPFITIIIQGINIINIKRIFNSYSFALLEDIQEIRYEDNQPYITIFLSMDRKGYATVPAIPFPIQGFTFPMIGELTNLLDNIDIAIISETLPASANNYLDYAINFQAVDWNFIRSLEIISSFCTRYALQVKNLDIQIRGSSLFTVSCTLSHCDTVYVNEVILGNEKYYIPVAFGFRGEEKKEIIVDEPANVPVIGSIRDSGSVTTFYRGITDGKIQVRVENER